MDALHALIPLAGMASLGVLGATLYFAPALLAWGRAKRNLPTIFACNLLLGWSMIGWAVALVWALTREAPESDPSERSSR